MSMNFSEPIIKIPDSKTLSKHTALVIEKHYRSHREKLKEAQAVVDDYKDDIDLLKKRPWKRLQMQNNDEKISTLNEDIYRRLVTVENKESLITTDTKVHGQKFEQHLKCLKNINENGRLRKLIQIQRENESMMKRIENTRPRYTVKAQKKWYKDHQNYKKSRRVDVTAGHIMRSPGIKSLLPRILPPLFHRNESEHENEMSSLYSSTKDSTHRNGFSAASSTAPSVLQLLGNNSDAVRNKSQSSHRTRKESIPTIMTAILEPMSHDSKSMAYNSNTNKFQSSSRIGRAGWQTGITHDSKLKLNSKKLSTDKTPMTKDISSGTSDENSSDNSSDSDDDYIDDFDEQILADKVNSSEVNEGKDASDSCIDLNDKYSALTLFGKDLISSFIDNKVIVLLARPFAIPFDSKNCIVQICITKEYDDNIYIRVISTSSEPHLYSERPLHIEKAYEMVQVSSTTSIIHQISNDDEDVHALRALLINMFREADTENSGIT